MEIDKKQRPPEADSVKQAEKPSQMRPSDRLLSHHVTGSLRTHTLGPDIRSEVIGGSVDLYSRIKPRDAFDSILIASIVALYNANMDSFSEAARIRDPKDDNRRQAIEGTAMLMQLIKTLEERRFVNPKEAPKGRRETVEAIMEHFQLHGDGGRRVRKL